MYIVTVFGLNEAILYIIDDLDKAVSSIKSPSLSLVSKNNSSSSKLANP